MRPAEKARDPRPSRFAGYRWSEPGDITDAYASSIFPHHLRELKVPFICRGLPSGLAGRCGYVTLWLDDPRLREAGIGDTTPHTRLHHIRGAGVSAEPAPEPVTTDEQYGEEFEIWKRQ